MPRQSSRTAASDGEQFVRPLTDTIQDLEAEYNVIICTSMLVGGRRGELAWAMTATPLENGAASRPYWVVQRDWPHSTVQSLPALLYNMAFSLGRLIEEGRRDQSMRGERWGREEPRGRR